MGRVVAVRWLDRIAGYAVVPSAPRLRAEHRRNMFCEDDVVCMCFERSKQRSPIQFDFGVFFVCASSVSISMKTISLQRRFAQST